MIPEQFLNSPWLQNFNPLGNQALSTAAAATPVLVLFYFLAVRRSPAWRATVYAFVAAVAIALAVFGMPLPMLAGAAANGLVFGWFRAAWIVVTAVFVYELSIETGQFEKIKLSIAGVSDDRRIQVLLIAFAFGSLLEGAGGGGAPVAVTGALLIGIGFPPIETVLMCLIANTAPVAFGALGTPIRTLAAATGLPEAPFSAMIGRILPLTTLVLPFWIVRVMCSTRETLAVWPGLLCCGATFGCIQFFWSNFVGATLVDVISGMGTLVILTLFFRVWKPRVSWRFPNEGRPSRSVPTLSWRNTLRAWSPFLLLSLFAIAWGLPAVSKLLDIFSWKVPVPFLNLRAVRMPPVVLKPYAEPAVFDFAWISSSGTGTLLSGFVAGKLLGLSFRETSLLFVRCLWRLRLSIVTIMAMVGTGYIIRYCGMDATMGMAMSRTGVLFPLFGTAIGWIGVALSGSDAGANALFGGLQTITASQLGLSPILMGAANSAGGVMGKMLATQSLVIACAATGLEGTEGLLFRQLLKHSVALVILVAALVTMYAYLFPGSIPKIP